MKKYNLQQLEDTSLDEIPNEFTKANGEELTASDIADVLSNFSEDVAVFLKNKLESRNYVFLAYTELNQVIGLPIIEEDRKVNDITDTVFFAEVDSENKIFFGNKLFINDYYSFKESVRIAVLSNFFKTGTKLYKKVDLEEVKKIKDKKIHKENGITIFQTKDKTESYILTLSEGDLHYLIPLEVYDDKNVNALFIVGEKRIIKKHIGKLPDGILKKAKDEILEMIDIIENLVEIDNKTDNLTFTEENNLVQEN